MYYEITVEKSARDFGTKDEEKYSLFDIEHITQRTEQEVRAWLKEYRKGKKAVSGVYHDVNGVSVRLGTVYQFKDSDVSHNSEPWIEQDWVTVDKVVRTPVRI